MPQSEGDKLIAEEKRFRIRDRGKERMRGREGLEDARRQTKKSYRKRKGEGKAITLSAPDYFRNLHTTRPPLQTRVSPLVLGSFHPKLAFTLYAGRTADFIYRRASCATETRNSALPRLPARRRAFSRVALPKFSMNRVRVVNAAIRRVSARDADFPASKLPSATTYFPVATANSGNWIVMLFPGRRWGNLEDANVARFHWIGPCTSLTQMNRLF